LGANETTAKRKISKIRFTFPPHHQDTKRPNLEFEISNLKSPGRLGGSFFKFSVFARLAQFAAEKLRPAQRFGRARD
jgi:hypothetical protein